MKTLKIIPFIAFLTLCCNNSSKEKTVDVATAEDGSMPALSEVSANLPLNSIKLPPGFTIDIFAEVDNARSMVLTPSGTLFVGNKDESKVYAVKDTDGDSKADKKWVIAT